MKQFKLRWEIQKNWQLIFPVLGIISLLFSSYLISKSINNYIFPENKLFSYLLLIVLTLISTWLLTKLVLKIFEKLEPRWQVQYRWELIAIFIVFAITGSTSARISDPIISFLGFSKETTNGFIYWPIRILVIFPIYQLLLVCVGWLFGQFTFFWNFEKKMLSRLGFARFFKD